MAGDAVGGEPRYWAFISYSHRDAAFGRLLHRRLESYYLPRRLVGRRTAYGIVPRRLAPIFRDREEFPASSDLSAEVRAALSQSHSLVVVCSPNAAASKWVSREVELFHELHPDRPVFAALRDGDPARSFPEAMLGAAPNGERIEPLAADFRPHCDGTHLGLLKLVAGITGVGLDELVQRDAQRYRQRVTAITAAALATVLVMGALTVAALEARKEAERQRGEAEGLVEYMLTDLRDRLKGVGRLDVMTAVNQRALHYYEDEDLATLPVDSLERRASILQAMGEDDESRGDLDTAFVKFREAERTTATLLAESPHDPDRVFDQAQSVFWIGSIDYARRKYTTAEQSFQKYRQLALELVLLSPRNGRSYRELGYAEGDICSVLLQPPRNAAAALEQCSAALTHMEMAAARLPDSAALRRDLLNRHSWLVSAYLAAGDRVNASRHLAAQERILDELMHYDPRNMKQRMAWIAMQRQTAWMEAHLGRQDKARIILEAAAAELRSMAAYEPADKSLVSLRENVRNDLLKLTRNKEDAKP